MSQKAIHPRWCHPGHSEGSRAGPMRDEHWLRRQRGALALLATEGRFISPRGVCFSTITFSFPEESLLSGYFARCLTLAPSGNTHYKFSLFLANNQHFASRRLRRLTQNLRVASPSLPSGRYTRRRGIKASVATTEPLGSQRSTKPKAKSTMRVLRKSAESA